MKKGQPNKKWASTGTFSPGRECRLDWAAVSKTSTHYYWGVLKTMSSPALWTLRHLDHSSGGPHWVAPLSAGRKLRLCHTGSPKLASQKLWKKPRPGLMSHNSCRDLDGRVRIWCKQHEDMDWASSHRGPRCHERGDAATSSDTFLHLAKTLFRPHSLSQVPLPTVNFPC